MNVKVVSAALIIFLFANLNCRIYAGEPRNTDLWPMAVRAADKNRNWIPGSIEVSSIEMDLSGNIRKKSYYKLKIYRGVSNDFRSEILKYVENGKDITDKRKKVMDDMLKKDVNANRISNIGFEAMIPFYPDDQNITVHKKTGGSGIFDGKTYLVYSYERKTTNISVEQGEAWLDSVSGMPLLLRFTFKPLPNYIFSLTNEIHFIIGKNGRWYPDRESLEGTGGFAFNVIRMTTSSVFSNYWYNGKMENR